MFNEGRNHFFFFTSFCHWAQSFLLDTILQKLFDADCSSQTAWFSLCSFRKKKIKKWLLSTFKSYSGAESFRTWCVGSNRWPYASALKIDLENAYVLGFSGWIPSRTLLFCGTIPLNYHSLYCYGLSTVKDTVSRTARTRLLFVTVVTKTV